MVFVRLLKRLSLAACLSGCLAACTAGGPRDACRLTYAGQAPLLRYANRLFVPALVNGSLIDLLLDTGGDVSLLSAAHAQLLKLSPGVLPARSKRPAIYGVGGRRTVHLMFAESLRFGNLLAVHVPFVVPDQDARRAANDDLDTLGLNFLAGFDMDVDMLGARVLFYRATAACTVPHVLMPPPLYSAQDVFSIGFKRPIVLATVHGQAFRALLDTGSPGSVLFHDAAERLGLNAATMSADARTNIKGVGLDTVDVARHLSEPISVGGLTISRMRINVSSETNPVVEMILGMDFLSKVHLWLSNSSREVVMQFPPSTTKR